MLVAVPHAVDHYENFPVASWLCPPRLRAPIAAIYRFARTADDLADEGDVSPAQRLADLRAYQTELDNAVTGTTQPGAQWRHVFQPLGDEIRRFSLPITPFYDLLSAFGQDVCMTRDAAMYRDLDSLLDYCRRSANPVGRLLLHLYGVHDAESQRLSDHVCTALQLINFWQDLSVDLPRGRCYLPQAESQAHGVLIQPGQKPLIDDRSAALLAELTQQARQTMLTGAPLVHHIPGRAGWELRAVVQGGFRTLCKVQALGTRVFDERPTVGILDVPLIAWRMLRMPQSTP